MLPNVVWHVRGWFGVFYTHRSYVTAPVGGVSGAVNGTLLWGIYYGDGANGALKCHFWWLAVRRGLITQ
jgi:hypothetical protein